MKMIKRYYIIILALILLIPAISNAQRWKRLRYEAVYGLGASNFLGELGGANQIGTNYAKDLELSMTRYVLAGGLRYKLTKWLSAKGQLNIGMLSGSDQTTEEPSRLNRNLSFKSTIIELSVQIEPQVTAEKTGSRYRLRGVKGRSGISLNTYPFIGVGVFYFNPKAQYNGVWHALQPLGTEGQGQVPGREKYSRIQLCIPMGFGLKYGINRKLSIGLEYGIRKTFTDYIDDVSTTYVDPDYIIRGVNTGVGGSADVATALADPSDGSFPEKTAPGEQRGDPADKDVYMFAIFTANYKFRVTKRRRRSRPKF
jgi:hypothetical protein